MRILLTLLLLGLLQSVDAQVQRSNFWLKDSGPICVVVEGPTEDAKSLGITDREMKTTVELRLRTLGLPITSDRAIAGVTLYINASTSCGGPNKSNCAMSVSLEFWQDVILVTDYLKAKHLSDKVFNATTYHSLGLKIGSRASFTNWKDTILQSVDQFANAYLAANPRE